MWRWFGGRVMMLVEQGAVPGSALPVAEFRDHLRLGTGFADEALQDGLLASHLRAAMAAIEGRIGKVLIARRFLWTVDRWRDGAAQALPVAPITGIAEVTLVDAAGGRVTLPAGSYRLVTDSHRPKLAARSGSLPLIPEGGRAEVLFDAGFGAAWAALPADLAQAVLLLAAEVYDQRHGGAEVQAGLPFAVQMLIERWRTVRVLGGGAV